AANVANKRKSRRTFMLASRSWCRHHLLDNAYTRCARAWKGRAVSALVQVFGRRHPRHQPRALAAGVRKAPRHEIAVGDRRRCRNYGDSVAGSGVNVVERGGEMGNFATRHLRELNCERVTDRLCNAILRF